MNWYKKANINNNWLTEDDIEMRIDSLLADEFDEDITNDPDRFYKKLEIFEKIKNILAQFPPNYKIKKEPQGWSVATPEGHVVSYNEKLLQHAIPGGQARFNFMGLSY